MQLDPQIKLIIYGAVLLAVIILMPNGLVSAFAMLERPVERAKNPRGAVAGAIGEG
jgi:hypothetical protein